MKQGRLLLAAGIALSVSTNAAWAQSTTSPPKPAAKAAAPTAKPASKAIAPAPRPIAPVAPAPEEPKTLLGVRLGSPGGIGGYLVHAISPTWSVGMSIAGTPIKIDNEKVTLFGIAAEARYHWRGLSPKGGYLFGQLAYINGKFGGPPPEGTTVVSEEDANGLYPGVGIGYQTRTTGASWDMGIGFGRPLKFSRHYSGGGESDVTVDAVAYLGLGVWLP